MYISNQLHHTHTRLYKCNYSNLPSWSPEIKEEEKTTLLLYDDLATFWDFFFEECDISHHKKKPEKIIFIKKENLQNAI